MSGFTNPSRPQPSRTLGDSPHSDLTKRLIAEGLNVGGGVGAAAPLRLMAAADGYVMVRRASFAPFVITEAAWLSLPMKERAA